MEEEDRRLLSNYGEFLPGQEGDTLIEEGADQNSLLFLISGLLHVVTAKDDKLTLLARVEPGESIGEVNLFDPSKASASVVSKSFSQVWKADRNDLDGLSQSLSRRRRSPHDRPSLGDVQTSPQYEPEALEYRTSECPPGVLPVRNHPP